MYILFAILIFGFLIFIHELGHFLTAKALDVQVNEFSICMGPAIFKKQKGETLYSLRCIPVGGYCAMEGEDEESDNPRAFTSKVWWKRLIILAAGSFMNFLTGLVVLALIYSCVAGFSTAKISGFFDGCPLESSQGLQVGDELYKIDGRRVYIYSDVGTLLARNKTGKFDLVVKRDGKLIKLDDFEMKQQLYEVDGEQQYKYGLYFGYEEKTVGTVLKTTWYTALDFARLVWMSLGDLVSGLVSVNDMSGPVGVVSAIAQTGQSAATTADGILNVLYLGAFIAINLAVMNMLPLPALDGGRAFLLLVNTVFTAITKKKIPSKFEGYIHAAGMILLLGFMAFITLRISGSWCDKNGAKTHKKNYGRRRSGRRRRAGIHPVDAEHENDRRGRLPCADPRAGCRRVRDRAAGRSGHGGRGGLRSHLRRVPAAAGGGYPL